MPLKFADLLLEAQGVKPVTWASDAKEPASVSRDEATHEPAQKLSPVPLLCSATASNSDSTRQSPPPGMSSNKRGSEYKHGQPGREFEEERPDEPADEPKKATAAQMAQRKIKTLKNPRRANVSSGLVAFNPNPPSASSFNFGPDPSAGAAPSNPFAQQQSTPGGSMFGQSQQQNSSDGSLFAFGSNAASSFPPAQSSTPNNLFAQSTNSSFPPASGFGGNNAGSASPFNPQPDMNFGNSTTNFGASAPAPANGFTFGAQSSQAPAFGASQNTAASTPASTSFSFLGAAAKNNESTPASSGLSMSNNNASTSATSGGLFGTSATTQNNTFGGFGPNANNSTAAPTSPFGNPFDKANDTSTPFQFGASTTPTTAAQDNASTPKPLFGGFGSASQPNANSQAPASPFNSHTATAGGSNMFRASSPGFAFGAQSNGLNSLAASTQGESAATPAFSFGNSTVNPATPAPSNNLFGYLGASTQASTSTPAPVSFGGFGQSLQAQFPSAPAMSGLFTESQVQAPTGPIATPISKSSNKGPSTAPAKKRAMFSNYQYVKFSLLRPNGNPCLLPPPKDRKQTDQESKKWFQDIYKIMSPTFVDVGLPLKTKNKYPLKNQDLNNQEKKPNISRRSATDPNPTQTSQEETTTTETTAQTIFKQAPFEAPQLAQSAQSEKQAPNSFASLSSSVPASSSSSNSLFPSAKPAASTQKPALTATLTPATEPAETVPAPQIPKVTVPPSWTVPDDNSDDLREHTKLLEQINDIYRTKLAQLPTRADWSALSKWHWQESSKLKKKIDDLKKQAATAKGITGEESVLSTKRKTDATVQLESPFKKARSGEAPTTPNAKVPPMASTSPKANPPSKPFNLFASASTQQTSSTADEPAQAKATESKVTGSGTTMATQDGFKPNFGTSASSSATGFKPSFGASSKTSGSSSSGFFGQFGGKTMEQLREERMKKAMDDGYESPTTSEEAEGDYETREQWLARWNKEENERQAALDAATSNTTLKFAPTATGKKIDTPAFKFNAASSNAASSSDSIVASQGLASGASTPGFFGSRVSSPAPSVLNTPLGAQTPSSNLFGHLSAASSRHQDDSDDEADDEAAARPSVEEESKKRKLGDSGDAESESSETLEESMRRKKPTTQKSSFFDRITRDNSDVEQEATDTTKKPSLLDRMTRDNSEAASDAAGKEASQPSLNSINSKLYNINGSQTPAPKKPFTFDFAAAAKSAPQSAPPKQNIFAGDQTFKFGDPIKFGSSTNTNTPFTITPATPTPASPAASSAALPKAVNSPFAFLSAAPSATTSAMSSRAATPASDADASATEGAAVNEDEGQTHVESDKSILSNEEQDEFDVLFEAEQVIANKQIHKEGAPKAEWVKIANGRLWILKSKADNHVILRLRMKSGAVRVNYRIPPIIKSSIMGANKTQVLTKEASVKDGKTVLENMVFAFNHKDKATKQELAKTFSETYNDNVAGA
ncbi:uncharacterized protein N0V89_002835 [Didymosphaeria variabile]|uniref:Nuclear pore complex NUP2/50/61 domain-containing protein n=1 Tax=Didymosphaeria variabile TaxID=1932322 RepID=A0A9W8XSF1_9PLEO|nr:uncharacterized protein N0V89_002835 [Didymosphaeria variabile]KAJ4358255.1 hypothetical protein N0V89_002835 [Didymosphaeria variabile]